MPPVKKSIPVSAARGAAWFLETVYRTFGIAPEPPLTRFFVRQMASAHYFDISAARRDLGYNPEITIEDGMERLRLALCVDKSLRPEPHMV